MPHFIRTVAALAIAAVPCGLSAPVQAQEKFLSEIFPVAFNFCPKGTAMVNGQFLPINQNQALFALIGTTYGGNGQTTFALPDLRGRSPMHVGQGPELDVELGQSFGTETNTLVIANMPAHNHNPRMRVSRVNATSTNPVGAYVARAADNVYDTAQPVGTVMAADAIQSNMVGGGQPVNNMMPTLVLNYCIALQGIFPSQN